MKKRLRPSNFATLQQTFSCIILTIEDGWYGGAKRERWPYARKTIHFVDGTMLTVFEEIDPHTNTVQKYQYAWEYKRGYFWKWHNDPPTAPHLSTSPAPHHMHHHGPRRTSHTRFANWQHHDLFTVLETIRTLYHVSAQ